MSQSSSWRNSRESRQLYARIKNPVTAADHRLAERYRNPQTDADWVMCRRVDEEASNHEGFFDSQSGRLVVIIVLDVFLTLDVLRGDLTVNAETCCCAVLLVLTGSSGTPVRGKVNLIALQRV